MSTNINKVIITGNLTRDMEVRTTQSGSVLGLFGIACNEGYKNPSTGNFEDRPNFFNCVMFGKMAEKTAQYLTKGTKVAIDGHLHYSSWEKDGEKRSNVDIIVEKFEFIGSKKKNDDQEKQNQQVAEMNVTYNDLAPKNIPF